MIHFEKDRKLVVGVGSALMDILAHEDDEFLKKTEAVKGGMIYVSPERIEQILLQLSKKPAIVPGGSACNTIVGIAKLGGKARFVGKSGTDDMADFFKESLEETQTEPVIFTSSSPTGRVLSVITPDAQRSMLTYLGAASEMSAGEISEKLFEDAAIIHIEGYLLFNRELMLAIATAAKNVHTKISLDLASFNVVEASKDFLEEFVQKYADILIANEDEARVFT
jgi:sugar/nucleoside kinase (ribokinase family)